VVASNQDHDLFAAVLVAGVKVTKPAEIAEGDSTAAIEPVAAGLTAST
jgi:hypothetical protein